MSAAVVSTPTAGYMSVRGKPRDCNMSPISPSCRAALYHTPPRLSADPSSALSCDSPMLTPSPLRRGPLFSPSAPYPYQDHISLESPFNSPSEHRLYPQQMHKQPPLPIYDDEGSIFLSSPSAAPSPFFSASISRPLRTPVKEEYLKKPTRSALKNQVLSTRPAATPSRSSQPHVARVEVGTKRKSSAQSGGFSTPLRRPVSTPLSISAAKADPTSGIAFHRLAPLPAPRFGTRTPQSRTETDAYMKKQAETLKRLRIRDMDNSDEDWGFIEDVDSGCEDKEDRGMAGKKLFAGELSTLSRRSKSRPVSPKQPLLINVLPQKGSLMDEVTEAISPGGHIIKRRARSRPVSQELLESANHASSSPASAKVRALLLVCRSQFHIMSQPDHSSAQRAVPSNPPPVAFPTMTRNRLSIAPLATSPTRGSPMPRRRLTGSSGPNPFQKAKIPDSTSRTTDRSTSSSSASLFFGPSIPQSLHKPHTRTSMATNPTATAPRLSVPSSQQLVSNRHSYAGPGSTMTTPLPWKLRSTQSMSSPDSSPVSLPQARHNIVDDEMFLDSCGPSETSFAFSVTEDTPSPRSRNVKEMLPLKYKPRDSGVVLSDDEDASRHRHNNLLSAMPQASASTSSLHSDDRDDLVTPVMPGISSGWPHAVVIRGPDEDPSGDGLHVDEFIMRTLASGNKPPAEAFKRPPGTPVKKLKPSYLGGNRLWQSAVAQKVGLYFEDMELQIGGQAAVGGGKSKNGPRKSLPAAFPHVTGGGASARQDRFLSSGPDSDEDQDNSPSVRKDAKYGGLGLGYPPTGGRTISPSEPTLRTRWLMRRSSSGAFSSGSETSVGTPTRRKGEYYFMIRWIHDVNCGRA